jgi:hypothetical protein
LLVRAIRISDFHTPVACWPSCLFVIARLLVAANNAGDRLIIHLLQ